MPCSLRMHLTVVRETLMIPSSRSSPSTWVEPHPVSFAIRTISALISSGLHGRPVLPQRRQPAPLRAHLAKVSGLTIEMRLLTASPWGRRSAAVFGFPREWSRYGPGVCSGGSCSPHRGTVSAWPSDA